VRDVIVIGAGVSGCVTAEGLAARGFRTLLLEKKAAAGLDVCCTGIIGHECLEMLNVAPLVRQEARGARFVAPSGRSTCIQRATPVAYILDRGELDRTLLSRAVQAGVEAQFGARVLSLEPSARGVKVQFEQGGKKFSAESRYAVLATGYGSGLPRSLGFGKIDDHLAGAQAVVTLKDPGESAVDSAHETALHRPSAEVRVLADQNLWPGGFAWLVPTGGGQGLAGLVTRGGDVRQLDTLLQRFKAQGLIISTDCCRSYGPIPIRPRPRTGQDRLLVVGDAAGHVKPTTGGGIYYGALGAHIAVDVLTSELSGQPASGIRTYQTRWQQRLNAEMRLGYFAQKVWRRLQNPQIESLFDLAMRHDMPDRIATSPRFSFDWHGPLLLETAQLLSLRQELRSWS